MLDERFHSPTLNHCSPHTGNHNRSPDWRLHEQDDHHSMKCEENMWILEVVNNVYGNEICVQIARKNLRQVS